MSYQEPNQPFGPPPQQQEQQQQQQGQQRQPAQSQPGWGQPASPGPWEASQGSWGQPGAAPQNSGQNWGSAQGQIPQQPHYASAPGYVQPGQTGQPQDFVPPQQQQQFGQQPQYGAPQPGYGQVPGYPGGPQGQPGQPGYLPQTDFGSGAGYPPGFPPPNQGDSGLATASLWLGILGGWGLINLILSIFAIRETGPGKKLGRTKAVAGLILTIAWSVVWIGVAVAVSNHARNEVAADTAPTAIASGTAGSGTGSGSGAGAGPTGAAPSSTATSVDVQANGAADDPGCQAVKTAYNTFTADPGASDAVSTYISALQAAAAESQVAGSQIDAMVTDLQQVEQTGQEPASADSDAQALESACDISFATSAAN
jgi:hypothetical protein